MTTPAAVKPLPPHGSTARANGRADKGRPPCHCAPCRKANRRYQKALDYDHHNGLRRTCDAAKTAAEIRHLINCGMTKADIAAAADCNVNSIRHALIPGVTVNVRLAESIAGIRVTISPTKAIPAFGARRRVQAAAALGHTEAAFAAQAGLAQSYINELARGRKRNIFAGTFDRIDAAYRALLAGPVPTGRGAAKARNRARAQGWPTPDQWDGHIDDADADPLAWARPARQSIEDLVADAEELYEKHGLSWEAAAAQLGLRTNTLHQYRTRVRRAQESAA